MKQPTLTGFENYGKTIRRTKFLTDTDQIIQWSEVAAAVVTVYPTALVRSGCPLPAPPPARNRRRAR
jgi:hypothetical protein